MDIKHKSFSPNYNRFLIPIPSFQQLGNQTSVSKILITKSILLAVSIMASSVAQANTSQNSKAGLYDLLEAEFSYDRQQSKNAIEVYKNQSFTKDSHEVFERAYQLSIINDDVPQTLAFTQKWQKQHPNYKPAWLYIAHLALQAHDYQLASRKLKHILKKDPDANLQEVLKDIYPTTVKDKKKLLMALDQLEKHDNSSLIVLKAGLLLEFGSLRNALREVKKAIRIEPYNTSYVILKADILKKLGRDKQLLTFLRGQRAETPDEKQLYTYEIRHHLTLNKLATTKKNKKKYLRNALSLSLEASEEFSEDPEINLLTALISLDLDEYEQAEKYLTKLIKEPNYYNQGFYHLGVSAEKQANYEQARHYFSQIKQADLALKSTKRMIDFELKANNVDNAIDAVVLLRSRFKQYASLTYILQSNILKKQGKTYKAKSLLKKQYQRYPNDDQLQFAYTQLLDNSSDYQVKLHILQKLYQKNPSKLDYQLHYGLILLMRSPDNIQGQQLLKNITQINSTSKNYSQQKYITATNALATIDFSKKKYQRVISAMQTAYRKQPNITSGILLLDSYRATDNKYLVKSFAKELKQRFNYVGKKP